jgi:hypothetical protein
MKTKKRIFLLAGLLAALLLASLACSLPWSSNEDPPEITEEIIETEPLVALTVEVEEEPERACPPDMIESLAFSVRFCYPSALAAGFTEVIIPERLPTAESPPWDSNPTMIELTFADYMLPETFHIPAIRIYPVEEYTAMDPFVGDMLTELQALLDSRNPAPDNIPFLPIWGAAQMMRAQVHYLEFQNGRGVRFITQYGQAIMPVNSESTFYAFMGLTNDGQYILSGVLPIAHPSLYPTAASEPAEGWDAFIENYETYLNETTTRLNDAPPESFLPGLGMLDAMMETFLIPPETLP